MSPHPCLKLFKIYSSCPSYNWLLKLTVECSFFFEHIEVYYTIDCSYKVQFSWNLYQIWQHSFHIQHQKCLEERCFIIPAPANLLVSLRCHKKTKTCEN
jgi:hypothetical protein